MFREAEALVAQARLVGDVLSDLREDEWERTTRCPPLTVREMTGHLGGMLEHLADLNGSLDGEPTTDRVRWWGYDRAQVGERVIAGSREAVGERGPGEVLEWYRRTVDRLEENLAAADPGLLAGRGDVRVRLDELVATRVLETTVHGMDIGHATLRGERANPEAERITIDILDGLLGSRPPAVLGWSPRTYVLTGTGRRRLEPNERHSLGELAGKFPLIG